MSICIRLDFFCNKRAEYDGNLWQEARGFVVCRPKDANHKGGDREWGEPSPTKKK